MLALHAHLPPDCRDSGIFEDRSISESRTRTKYGYDALNRLTGKTYSNGDHAITYAYDGSNSCLAPNSNPKGHRTSMADASGTSSWCFDIMGRAVSEQRTINGIAKSMSTTYDLDGSAATLTYPSGRVLTYSYSGAGDMLSAIDATNNLNFATGATYSPWGALTGVTYGQSGSFTGIVTSNGYNKRLQPTLLSANAPSQTVMSLSYNFGMGTNDNGNVYGVTNNLDGIQPNRPNGSQAYTYDALNRVTLAQTPAAMADCTTMPSGLTKDWGQSFTYDAWGNLNTIAVSRCSTPTFSGTALANNQLGAPYTYDADGNMTFDGTTHYTYNAENQVATAAGVSYTYDGDGERVAKSTGKLYWGGSGANALDESDSGGNFTEEYVFFGGKRIARLDLPGGATHYYFPDHLGSASVVTSADGSVIEQESDYYAFGGERAIVSGPNVYKFTGKERDGETGNDYFGARYFGSPMGRWLTPDWSGAAVPVPYAVFADPQTLNLYSYVRDNPLANADLDGHSPYASICCNFMRGGGEVEQRLDMCSIAGCSGEGAFEQMDVQDSDDLRLEMAFLFPQAQNQQLTIDESQSEQEAVLANIVYNETSKFRADPNAEAGDPGSTEDLHNARLAVAEIANRLIAAKDSDHYEATASQLSSRGVIASPDLSFSEAKHESKGNADVIMAHNDALKAAREAIAGSNTTNGATQYRTRRGHDVTTNVGKSKHNPGTPVSMHFGPFLSGRREGVLVVAP